MTRRDVPMSLRRLIVEVDTAELNVTAFCGRHGISTWFFYDVRRRFAAGGWEAIEPRSRAAHRVANRTSTELEDVIVALRKELADTGLDAGPVTIASHLERRGIAGPSVATIWRVLSRRGFVETDPSKAPRRAVRRFAADRANECWQYDDTTWSLRDGTPVKIINVIDDCTRLAVACRAVPSATTPAVFNTLAQAAAQWGWPERTLCDNAKAHLALDDTFAALGIATSHPRPHHPQTCGKAERFHQTEQRWLAAHPAAATINALQRELDRFRDIYNNHRPHRALDRRTPAEIWHSTPKSAPATQPLGTPTEVRELHVAHNGIISWSRRYQINVGTQHAGAHATVIITGLSCHVFIAGRVVRNLTLNPTRRSQPLQPTPRNAPRHP
jgi:transposase InsO family protein